MNGNSPYKKLRPSGGYRTLRSFQTTTIIYDTTVSFCERFIDKRSRLVDQMVQAARSGRQNIAEGSRASATSSQMAAARVQKRSGFNRSDRTDPSDKKPALSACQLCGRPMVLRTAKLGKNAGSQFLGCSGYPECKSTSQVVESA